jgi:hypothetical protein
MEQQLDATYLRPCFVTKAFALSVAASPNVDKSSTRVDIAVDGTPLSETALALVPESGQALKKCQWWHA